MVNSKLKMHKSKSLEKYINEIYNGDTSKLQIFEIDYSNMQSPQDIAKWAIDTFELSCPTELSNDSRSIIDSVFDSMGKQVKQNYVIRELKRSSIPDSLKDMIYDFKVAISFHFYREFGYRIDFIK
jgi:hypothetical protein